MEAITELIEALSSASQRESVRLNDYDLWITVFTRAITALSHRNRRPGSPLTGSLPFLDLFTQDSYIVYEPDGYPWAPSRAVFDALCKTLHYRCQAQSQTLETASKDILHSVMHDLFDAPDPSSPEVLITASICLCRWEWQFHFADREGASFRSAIIRRLWRGQNPSEFRKHIQDLIEKANANLYSYHLSYAYARTLVDITTLPEAQSRSLVDIIFAIRTVFNLEEAFRYHPNFEDPVPLQSIVEYFLLATERPESPEQFTSRNFEELRDLYNTIYEWQVPTDWNDERSRQNREIKHQILDTLRQAWRNLGGYMLE